MRRWGPLVTLLFFPQLSGQDLDSDDECCLHHQEKKHHHCQFWCHSIPWETRPELCAFSTYSKTRPWKSLGNVVKISRNTPSLKTIKIDLILWLHISSENNNTKTLKTLEFSGFYCFYFLAFYYRHNNQRIRRIYKISHANWTTKKRFEDYSFDLLQYYTNISNVSLGCHKVWNF